MDQEKTIPKKDLKQGDILLFAPGDNLVFKIIAWITDATVSHAAFSYNEADIIEETPPYAQINPLADRIEDRKVTVMRMNPEVENMEKIIDIAKVYVDKKTPYPKALIAVLAVYFLTKKVIYSPTLWRLVSILLKIVITQLMTFIDKEFYGDTHPMECSQFVYHCHQEAGGDYALIFKKKAPIMSFLNIVEDHISSNKAAYEGKLIDNIADLKIDDVNTIDLDNLLEQIYEEVQKAPKAIEDPIVPEEEVVQTVHEFCMVLEHFMTKTHYKMPVFEEAPEGILSLPIHHVLIMQEYFVTPGDLMDGFENLACMGTLE